MGEGPFVAGIFGVGFCDRSQLFPNEGDRWVEAFPSCSSKDETASRCMLCFVLEMIGGVRDSADLILPI